MTVNLAPMPEAWREWGSQGLGNYLFIDNSVLHNGHSTLRMQADYGTRGSGRDGFIKAPNSWIPIKPGDHIVFSCWMKLNAGNGLFNGDAAHSGSRLGIDFYDNVGHIGDTSALNGNPDQTDAETRASLVNWGDTVWEKRTMDFIVHTHYDEHGAGRRPTGMIPWIQTVPRLNTGYGWFADCELYVNPGPSPIEEPVRPFICASCGSGPYTQAELDAHVASVHPTDVPLPTVAGSPMWVASECGLAQDNIDLLRFLGHRFLPPPLIDWYHRDGEDFAVFLRGHPESKRWVKFFFDLFFDNDASSS